MSTSTIHMQKKAAEWLSVKHEMKDLASQATAVRKRLKTIESDLVSMMTTEHTETIDIDGKTIQRSRGLGTKDM
jgi:hypothetical protein